MVDLVLEMQRLRRMEKRVIALKKLHFRPLNNVCFHATEESVLLQPIVCELLRDVPGEWRPDTEAMIQYRKDNGGEI